VSWRARRFLGLTLLLVGGLATVDLLPSVITLFAKEAPATQASSRPPGSFATTAEKAPLWTSTWLGVWFMALMAVHPVPMWRIGEQEAETRADQWVAQEVIPQVERRARTAFFLALGSALLLLGLGVLQLRTRSTTSPTPRAAG
jgi:hypothetical protein